MWLNNCGGPWQAHFAPFARVSRSFSKYTEAGALFRCFQYLWKCYCLVAGLTLGQCPMKGVFVAKGSSDAASSSSGSGSIPLAKGKAKL